MFLYAHAYGEIKRNSFDDISKFPGIFFGVSFRDCSVSLLSGGLISMRAKQMHRQVCKTRGKLAQVSMTLIY